MNHDARTSWRHWAALTLIVQAALLLLGCSETGEPPSRQAVSQSAASQAALDRFVAAEQPGCSAAVGRRGNVMWRGAQGVADLDTGAPVPTGRVREATSDGEYAAWVLDLDEQVVNREMVETRAVPEELYRVAEVFFDH